MVTSTCVQCGAAFLSRLNRERRTKLCSRACWKIANAAGAIRRERPCEACGVRFRPHCDAVVARGRGRFCSPQCAAIVHRLDRPKQGYKMRERTMEHRLVVERVLGRKLPSIAVVHHSNEDPSDNRPSNLVVCQGTRYHRILHARMRVKAAGGDPNVDKICGACAQVKPLTEFYETKGMPGSAPIGRRTSYCIQCAREIGRVKGAARLRARGVPTQEERWAAHRAAHGA